MMLGAMLAMVLMIGAPVGAQVDFGDDVCVSAAEQEAILIADLDQLVDQEGGLISVAECFALKPG